MCKVLMLTDATRVAEKEVKKLVNKVAELITKTDDDGFGWVTRDGNGRLFGERSTLTKGYKTKIHRQYKTDKLHDVAWAVKTYKRIGTAFGQPVGPMLFHGRTSTNNISLRNTHPIARNKWYLIHNGVVTNEGPKYEMRTTNDTEHLVHYLSTEGISGIEKNISGYYAVGAISPDGLLHIIKDATAGLYVSYIETIDSFIYATTESLIEDLCRAMKWEVEPVAAVIDDVYIILKNNECVHSQDIKSLGMRNQYQRDMMGRSLGRYSSGYGSYGGEYSGYSAWDDDTRFVESLGNEKPTNDDEGALTGSNIVDISSTAKSHQRAYYDKKKDENEGFLKSTSDETDGLTAVKVDGDFCMIDVEMFEDFAREYDILDENNNYITYQEFMQLKIEEKVMCTLHDKLNGEYIDPVKEFGVAN